MPSVASPRLTHALSARRGIGMSRLLATLALLIPSLMITIPRKASGSDPPEWTVLVYMNGDNNLERYAVINFAEMARVGSTDNVTILVQFDRIGKYTKDLAPKWT